MSRHTSQADVEKDLHEARTRLKAVESLLGLLPSGHDQKSKAIYLAYVLARGSTNYVITDAMERLERAWPGFLLSAECFAGDMNGNDAAELLRKS